MSPAQSEDSGLAPERGTTYATIHLARDNAPAMGIVLAGKYLIYWVQYEIEDHLIKRVEN